MYKIKIIEKSGAFCEYKTDKLDEINPTALGHGLPERVVLADTEYDQADVIEEIPAEIDENNEIIRPAQVKLKAEYTIEIVDITAEVEQAKINAECLKYLADTDWYVIRSLDGGADIPIAIKEKRAECRSRIVR